jgi:uracil-DNA glycosylase
MPFPKLPASWSSVLGDVVGSDDFRALERFVDEERARGDVYPPAERVFAAFERTPFDRVKVVLLGQDPYHGPGQAHGLCLSVPRGVKPPPSLANMLKELHDDLGIDPPGHGSLEAWADRGVLLLNACLTVRAGQAGSHAGKGWERFTDAVVRALDDRARPVVFVLWGNAAKKKGKLIDRAKHRVIEGVHPSPLSAWNGFFGSKPYSAINGALKDVGETPIDWRLPD